MTQYITNHLPWDLCTQQADRRRVAEDMRAALAAQRYTCCLNSPANFAVNANHRDIGRARADEDFPHIRFRAAMPEIVDQGLPNRLQQRQHGTSTGLGVADVQ